MNWITQLCIAFVFVIAPRRIQVVSASFDHILNGKHGSAFNYTGIPNLGSFTLCLWIKQEYSTEFWSQPILSYANDDYNKAIGITSIGGVQSGAVFYLMGNFVFYPQFNIKDKQWHNLCVTWNNEQTFMIGYVDGDQKVTADVVHAAKGATLKGGGCLIIGFDQQPKCTLKTSSLGYTGMISQVNIWSVALGPSDVNKVFRGCDVYHGNVLPWKSTFLNDSMTGINTTSPTSACQSNYISRTYIHHPNKMFLGHTMSFQTVPTAIDCAHACLNHNRCQSFNHYEGQEHNNCELNNSDDSNNPESLQYSSGVTYGASIDTLDKMEHSLS